MGAETKVPTICGRKNCTCCKRWKYVIEFHVRRRAPDGTPLNLQTACKTCQRETGRHNKGLQRRGRPYEPRHERMTPEEFRAHRRELYRERMKDEKYRNDRREYERIYAEAMRRQQGVQPRNFAERHLPGYGDLLPYEPLKEWIEKKLGNGYMGNVATLALTCGVDQGEINRIRRGEHVRISEDFADKMLVNEGSTYLWQVYPDLYSLP